MILELVVSVAMAVALDKLLKRTYPWLKSIPSKGGKLRKKYPEIIQKTKQVFFHQIAGVVLTQTSPLIIYAYASLTLVAIYGNYMLIILGVISLMNSLFNGINASVGNLVAEGDMERIKSVFWEFTSIKMWFASIICFGIYTLGHSFISLWVGKEFILEETAFQFLVIIAFINLTRTSQVFLSAFGLFQDIWAPLTEAILNLGLSILLGYYYGLTGILFGVLISLLLMVCCWKPVFLFKKGFKTSLNEYIWRYAKYVILILISWLAISLFLDLSSLDIIKEEYSDVLRENRKREFEQFTSLFGPHKDDLKISINDLDTRVYASQGQQRTAMLALKLAEAKLIEKLTQVKPILLLDDVFSELDNQRSRLLVEAIKGYQTIITTNSLMNINTSKMYGNIYKIEAGKVDLMETGERN